MHCQLKAELLKSQKSLRRSNDDGTLLIVLCSHGYSLLSHLPLLGSHRYFCSKVTFLGWPLKMSRAQTSLSAIPYSHGHRSASSRVASYAMKAQRVLPKGLMENERHYLEEAFVHGKSLWSPSAESSARALSRIPPMLWESPGQAASYFQSLQLV